MKATQNCLCREGGKCQSGINMTSCHALEEYMFRLRKCPNLQVTVYFHFFLISDTIKELRTLLREGNEIKY